MNQSFQKEARFRSSRQLPACTPLRKHRLGKQRCEQDFWFIDSRMRGDNTPEHNRDRQTLGVQRIIILNLQHDLSLERAKCRVKNLWKN